MVRGMRWFFSLSVVLVLAGCVPPQPPAPTPPTPHVIAGDSAAPPAGADAGPKLTSSGAMTPIEYRLQVPFGANSRDERFWKLVEEDVVDVPTGHRLNLNGIRTGRGKVADWPQFLKILTDESAIMLSRGQVLAQSAFGDATFPMTDTLPEELLLIYDEHGLTMRSFDDCSNQFSMAFAWAPRKPRTIRVTICPVVIATKTRADYAMNNNPPPVRVLDRENLYDLNLCSDISPGEFLVVGTSRETEDPNRVGSVFLTRDGPNQRFEELLIIVGDSVPMVPARHPAAIRNGATTKQSK
jgi:hypothetical protein